MSKVLMEMLHGDSRKQGYPGVCAYCGFVIVDFDIEERKREDFKCCRGFSHYDTTSRLLAMYECPRCFAKSHFHVRKEWAKKYLRWIEEESIFYDGE